MDEVGWKKWRWLGRLTWVKRDVEEKGREKKEGFGGLGRRASAGVQGGAVVGSAGPDLGHTQSGGHEGSVIRVLGPLPMQRGSSAASLLFVLLALPRGWGRQRETRGNEGEVESQLCGRELRERVTGFDKL
ncbi:hypothetical protein E2C01_100646 [Portunus trituberculatus]|uniref:Uncharacterized protein n=1 Tax=Portunus trituberculatus TaxID=210409 RepID=A0A5B7K3N2_PORTR|nr:hypothetical protein [Portunus trituberculatus]